MVKAAAGSEPDDLPYFNAFSRNMVRQKCTKTEPNPQIRKSPGGIDLPGEFAAQIHAVVKGVAS